MTVSGTPEMSARAGSGFSEPGPGAAFSAPGLPMLATPWDLVEVVGRDPDAAPGPTQVSSLNSEFAQAGPGALVYTGHTVPTPWPATYGGDLTVGALSAATRSASENQHAHSLQISFLRPGDPLLPVSYRVTPALDGFRYANYSVSITQSDTEIAVATVSLRTPRKGEIAVTGVPAPDFAALPSPDSLPTAAEVIATRAPLSRVTPETSALDEYWSSGRGLDTRHIDGDSYGEANRPRTSNRVWVRFVPTSLGQEQLLDSPYGPSALIAYLADDTILESALASLGYGWNTPGLFSATVQQSIWFHASFDLRDWLLFSQRFVSRAGDHVVCSGEIYTQSGALVATVLQEGIVRVRAGAH